MAITIPILTDFDGRGIDKGLKQFQQLETKGQKAAFAVKKAAVPAGIALAALGAGALVAAKAAAEDEAAQEKLAGTLERVTGASDDVIRSTESYISKLSQSVGVADDELRPALGKLATATGDVGKAQDLLNLSLDVAAQTGKPLESVTTALSKAYGGQFGALNKLIPGFDQSIIKAKDFTAAQDELQKLTGGAATEAANTAEGQFRRLSIAFEETKESIGAALLPIIQAFLPVLQRLAAFVQNNTDVVVILAGVAAGLATAILAINTAMKLAAASSAVMTGAQIALNIAMNANPIALVVTAIGTLIAIFATAYASSESFRNIVNGVFGKVRDLGEYVIDFFTPAFRALDKAVRSVFSWMEEYVAPVMEGVAKALKLGFAPILVAIDGMNRLLDLVSSFKKAIGGKGGAPNLTRPGLPGGIDNDPATPFAKGGIVRRPTLALIGEAGPEAVVPLNRAGGFGGMTINVQAGLVSTPDQVGQQIIEAIQRAQRRSGPAFASA